jgi:hypothetical protein
MADDTTSPYDGQAQGGRSGGGRTGGRPAGNREPGGFRIRLSDNEMRAARAVQDAFQLRSTVAALGFSIRTIAQLLEDGQLDALVAAQRAQSGSRGDGPRSGGRRGEPRPEERAPRIDPFARPARPAPAAMAADPLVMPVEAAEPAASEQEGEGLAELPSEPQASDHPGTGDATGEV